MKAVTNGIQAKLEVDAQLLAAAPGGVHARRAPLQTLPVAVHAKQAGRQAYTLSGRAWRALTYLVKGIAETREEAEAVDERCDALLSDGTITVTGHALMRLRRVGDVEFSETAKEGRVYWHVGGLYAIEVTPG